MKVESWLEARIEGRELILDFNEKKFQEESLLDSCYVIKSNLTDEISKETIHARYKDLAFVEQAFRCSKTELLELRPWFVQLEKSTRGHALIVMLSYIIVKKLKEYWKEIDNTVNEGLDILSKLCLKEVKIKNKITYYEIIEPSDTEKKFLKAANVKLPKGVPFLNTKVRSRKKLKR
jgi:transposase